MTQVVAYLEAIVGADITSFRRGMQDVRRETGILSDDFTGMAGQLAQVGQAMTYAITTPLLAVGESAIKSASSFDASMHNINSIVHMSGTELDALSKKVLDFGSTTRGGPQAVADSLYEIYSAGVTGQKAFDLMQVSVKTAEAGMADLEKTTNALTATVMAYANQNLSAADASNIWTKMVQVGVGSLDDFLANAQKVLPLGDALGISFQDVGANAAYLSQQGGGAKKAMTSLAMAFSNLLKPNQTMIDAFKKLGVATGQDLIKKFGSFEGAVQALHKAVADPVEFNKMFSKTGLEAVLSMTNNVDALNKSVKDFGTGLNDATKSAWDEQMKSYAASSDKFNSAVETLKIEIGTQLFPVMLAILQPITNFFLQLAKTNPEVLKMAVAFGVAAAAAGPLIWILSSLLSPIGLLVGVVAGLSVAFATNLGGIRDIVTGAISAIMPLLQPFIDGIKALWQVLSGTGVTLEQGKGVNSFIDDLNTKINNLLGGTLPTAVSGKEIKIPIKAGMTLSDLYYNSEWSKDLQSRFSYSDFVANAKTQIKGGDARWLQVGQDLTFQIGIAAQAAPPDERANNTFIADLGGKYNLQFLGIKEEIQKQYDYIFKDKPLVDDKGADTSAQLPVLVAVKQVIDNVKLIVNTWKDAFGVALNNIKDGISGFFDAFKGKDYSGLTKVFTTAITLMSDVWTITQIIVSKILIFASDILKDTLPKMGTVIADFLQTMSNIASGNFSIGNLDQLVLDIANVVGTIVDKILGGKGFDAASGLTQFAEDIRTGLMLLTFVLQSGWRDAKIWMNKGVSDFLDSLSDAIKTLHDAHLISDDQFINFQITAKNLHVDTQGAQFAKAIEDSLRSGSAFNGNINIGSDNLKMVVQMGGAKAIADNLTVVGKDNLLQAIKDALATGDKNGDLQVLLPIAVAGNLDTSKLDFSKLSEDTKAAIAKAMGGGSQGSVGISAADPNGLANTAAGKAIIDGLTKGITDNTYSVVDAIQTTSQNILDAQNNALGIHSPSTFTMQMGAMLIAGFVAAYVLGTPVLVIASGLLALIGVKIPITNAISPAWARGVGSGVSTNMAAGLSDGIPSLVSATNGVIGAMWSMEAGVVAAGNTMAAQMQAIVDKVMGQVAALKEAIKVAAGLSVPTGPTPTKGVTDSQAPGGHKASGGSAEGWQTVGERGPELVYFGQKGNVIPNHTLKDAMRGGVTENNKGGGNTIIVNGVQDVDKMLFELKRRGVKLT